VPRALLRFAWRGAGWPRACMRRAWLAATAAAFARGTPNDLRTAKDVADLTCPHGKARNIKLSISINRRVNGRLLPTLSITWLGMHTENNILYGALYYLFTATIPSSSVPLYSPYHTCFLPFVKADRN